MAGGFTSRHFEHVATVNIYDPETDEWKISEESLIVSRSGLSIAALDGKLYAVGGHIERGGNTIA